MEFQCLKINLRACKRALASLKTFWVSDLEQVCWNWSLKEKIVMAVYVFCECRLTFGNLLMVMIVLKYSPRTLFCQRTWASVINENLYYPVFISISHVWFLPHTLDLYHSSDSCRFLAAMFSYWLRISRSADVRSGCFVASISMRTVEVCTDTCASWSSYILKRFNTQHEIIECNR